MAMGTQRSRGLHNFTFPGGLRWGNQRSLRCIKVDSYGQDFPLREFTFEDSDSSGHRRHHLQPIQLPQTTRDRDREKDYSDSDFVYLGSHQTGFAPPQVIHPVIGDGEGNAAIAVGEKAVFDRQKAAGDLRESIFKEGRKGREASVSPPAAVSVRGDVDRPWNLRKRRASCVAGTNNGASFGGVGGKCLSVDGERHGDVEAMGGEKRRRDKFSVALSKREIEEDFLAFTGRKPRRRPKKRANNIQRELNTLFPGLWLTEVTPQLYKVSEAAQ